MKKITQKFVDEYFLRKENQRNPDSSKYDFGHVLVVAGSTEGIYFADGSFMSSAGLGSASSLVNGGNISIEADSDSNNVGEIQLKTKNAQRMVVTNDGNVGIGTATPTAALEVEGTIKGDHVFIEGASGNFTSTQYFTGTWTQIAGTNRSITIPDNCKVVMTWSTSVAFYNAGSNKVKVRPYIGNNTGTAFIHLDDNTVGYHTTIAGNYYLADLSPGTYNIGLQASELDGNVTVDGDDSYSWTIMCYRK